MAWHSHKKLRRIWQGLGGKPLPRLARFSGKKVMILLQDIRFAIMTHCEAA
jgi:hypothetical protein